MANMIFLANVLSHLEMRKALAHVKKPFTIYRINYLSIYIQCSFEVFPLWKKPTWRIQTILTDKKRQFSHNTVKLGYRGISKDWLCYISLLYVMNCAPVFPRLKSDSGTSFHPPSRTKAQMQVARWLQIHRPAVTPKGYQGQVSSSCLG